MIFWDKEFTPLKYMENSAILKKTADFIIIFGIFFHLFNI